MSNGSRSKNGPNSRAKQPAKKKQGPEPPPLPTKVDGKSRAGRIDVVGKGDTAFLDPAERSMAEVFSSSSVPDESPGDELPTVVHGRKAQTEEDWNREPSAQTSGDGPQEDRTLPLRQGWARAETAPRPEVLTPEALERQGSTRTSHGVVERAPARQPTVMELLDTPLEDGATVGDGRYTIEELIGEGLESRVYCAVDEEGQRCAIKEFLGASYEQMDKLLASFEDTEYRGPVPGTISHPAAVEVYDFFRDEARGPILVLEFVGGGSLAGLIERNDRPLPPLQALRLYLRVAEVVAAAHEQDLLIGDLHPRQILLDPSTAAPKVDPTAMLLAYSPAKLAAWLSAREPEDMAPEMASGQPDRNIKSDIFAFGASLARVVVGRSAAQVAASPRVLPPEVRAIVQRCLAAEPEARFESMAQLSKALARAASPSLFGDLSHRLPPPRWIAVGVASLVLVILAGMALGQWLGSAGVTVVQDGSAAACPAADELAAAAPSESRSDYQALRSYRRQLAQFPGCAELKARVKSLIAGSELKELRSKHRRKLMSLPENADELDEDQRSEIAESVAALEAIGLDADLVRFWREKIGGGK